MRRGHTVLFVVAAALFTIGAVKATVPTPGRPAGANPIPMRDWSARPAAVLAGHAAGAPAWVPQARTPLAGTASGALGLWLAEGEAESLALPHEHPDVLFVGDSIMQWWRSTGRSSWDRWFAPLGAADDGVAGDTTSNVLARLDAGQVPATPPKTIVLMIGTNNISLGQSPAEVTQGIQAVVANLHRRMPPSHIIVLGVLPRGHRTDLDRKVAEEVNRALRDAFRGTAVAYLDVGTALLERDGGLKPDALFPDLLHPTASGYALIAPSIFRKIRSLG